MGYARAHDHVECRYTIACHDQESVAEVKGIAHLAAMGRRLPGNLGVHDYISPVSHVSSSALYMLDYSQFTDIATRRYLTTAGGCSRSPLRSLVSANSSVRPTVLNGPTSHQATALPATVRAVLS